MPKLSAASVSAGLVDPGVIKPKDSLAQGKAADGEFVEPLVNVEWWESWSEEALIEVMRGITPMGTSVASYAGPDLCAAKPLPQPELSQLYSWPTADFRAGQGFANKEAWLDLVGSNQELRGYIERGGYSEFMRDWQSRVPVTRRANNPNIEPHHDFVRSAIADLLKVGGVEEVTHLQHDVNEVRVIAPLTIAEQGGGKLRLCWNGRPTNVGLDAQHFKMEHVSTIARMLRAGDLLMTVDLKAGYHQFPVTSWFRKFLCFEFEGAVYRWCVMPFGLSTAPRAFSKLTRALLKKWRSQGVRCSNYIDDFIFAVRPDEVAKVRAMVLQDFADLGLYISLDKSCLHPGTMAEYLGVLVCTVPVPHLRMPRSKVVKLRDSLRRILQKTEAACDATSNVRSDINICDVDISAGPSGVVVKGRTLARLLGMLQFFRTAVPMVAAFTKSLYASLRELPLDGKGWLDFNQQVVLSQAAVAECDFWYSRIKVWNGFPVRPKTVSRVLYTDGSGYGYAGVLHRVSQRVMEPAVQLTSGVWESHCSTDSVFTELQGLWRSLVAAGAGIINSTVLHRTDSISTYWIVRSGGSRSARLNIIARRIVVYCDVFNIHLAVEYVGAGVIIKSGADALSRSGDESECSLNAGVYRRLWKLFGGWDVDRFASGGSAQLHVDTGRRLPYWALYADGAAEGIDSLSAHWGGRKNYAFPPVKIVGHVVELVIEQQATTVLIAPKWESQWWWSLLVQSALLVVDLEPLLSEGSLFHEVRGNGLSHPLGRKAVAPNATKWVAAFFRWP